MWLTLPPDALEPSPNAKLRPGADMRSVAVADIVTGAPATPDAGTFAAVIAGGTGSKDETCAEVAPPGAVSSHAANALPWSSSAIWGESSRPPGDATVTGSTS